MPTLSGVHHIALTVTDVERSVPWYERVLGFTVIGKQDEDAVGVRKAFLRGPGEKFALTLVQHPYAAGSVFDENRPGLDHLSFSVPNEACLTEWTNRLNEHGVTFCPIIGEDSVETTAVIALRDPDGIQLVLWVEQN
jgi:catechol 2,3-dioxygenase-like lactoylglutathione lyase family enzyme